MVTAKTERIKVKKSERGKQKQKQKMGKDRQTDIKTQQNNVIHHSLTE